MKISEMITDRYKLRIPPTVYYDLLADVQELEEEEEPTTKNDLGVDAVSRQAVIDLMMQKWGENFSGDDAMQESIDAIRVMPSVTPQEPMVIPIAEVKFDEDKLKELVNKAVLTVASQEPCAICEVGNPCLYCKHEFEPQESEDKE